MEMPMPYLVYHVVNVVNILIPPLQLIAASKLLQWQRLARMEFIHFSRGH